jgi:PKD repeat protein
MRCNVALAIGASACVALAGCTDSFTPTGGVTPPDSVVATALGMRSVRITWEPSPGASGYVIERRANLEGAFSEIKRVSPGMVTQYVDDSLTPETIYGYRIFGLSNQGVESSPSLVAGTRTAPWPGIMASVATNPVQVAPSNGYQVSVVAPAGDTLRAALGAVDEHRFGPLPPGTYTVILSGATANCTVPEGTERTVSVTNLGLETLQYAGYTVSCRDPNRGSLTVHVATTGDSLDADGYVLKVSGVADDASLPDSVRAFLQQDDIGVQALRQYATLRPGNYTIELTGLAGNCAAQGPTTVSLHLNALEDLSRSFAVVCQQADDPTKPLQWRSTWSTNTAPIGSQVSLVVAMDLSRKPGQHVNAVQATLRFDPAVVRLDSVRQVAPWQVNANSGTPGAAEWLGFVNGAGPADSTTFARFYFTVVGGSGSTTTTGTSFVIVADQLTGDDLIPLTRKSEGTFTVAAGGGNQAPVARPGGPYAGSVGNAISFSGSTSSDPDGSIATYQWNFGDGATATGMVPTHTYAAANNYTVTLTVTDNGGLTGTATTNATVTTGDGGNQAPVAVANGPYMGVAGTPVSFSANGSHDNDGSIASYSWDFADGGTATGALPTHAYAAAGSYTITLTVTDNQGAMGSATAMVTVTGGASTPFAWRNDFGAVGPDSIVALTVTLDLSSDISQTPGVEELAEWHVDSLKWNPAVLRFFSFNFGPGGAGSVNPTDQARGKLIFSGVQNSLGNTGLITIARIQFKVIGAHGSQAGTTTALGSLIGTPATGSFGYRPYTTVVEGTVTAP